MACILVTGGSGFVGSHCIAQLLAAGHGVRATVRSLSREAEIGAMLARAGVDGADRLSLFAADLEDDAGWDVAVAGCEYVLHVASPFPASVPADPQELIRPARDGALRVLRAGVSAGVRRLVLTSSFAAVGYGHVVEGRPYDERDWTDVTGPDAHPYIQSKAIAERAAWDFMKAHGGDTELAVVNPVGIFGPALGPSLSTSVDMIRQMLAGEIAEAPRLHFGAVDVRDVADLHLRAMVHPAAAGERFLATGGDTSLIAIAAMLREAFPAFADRLPTREGSGASSEPPVPRSASSEKAQRLFGWTPRPVREAIVASAESLLELGLIPGP
ncbi:aldehyde reductase [Aurantimonas sp. 22II-16-19i]|uniref:SDR family oxidoreductase n=1 Tax=Aurantimonas sp. 22II-16-19i TaxID=1317114 RepID=UPI0009F7FFE9|nr:aldehyde reductase [Aurantimonas sp. 22II-16-19i]ORE97528.1 nucleoside-diphosphate-sugar epimerase [Aurantimonas sp. 22II-16-19i]